jgi:ornithine cyclodeaminase/alanine dehydrogenase-like protein (mu-crystallin family)
LRTSSSAEIRFERDHVALILSHDEVCASVNMSDAIEAVELGFREEGEGGVEQPQRTNIAVDDPKGFLRLGPCIMRKSRWMGFKAMNLAEGIGCRYQVHLYSMDDGALRAIMDAQFLTTLRTGATSAVATRRLARKGQGLVGVIGSGREAYMQLEAMRVLGSVGAAKVYSPTRANRETFAAHFRDRFGMEIVEVDSAEAAVDGAAIVVAAVASSRPAIMGQWLKPGVHINSVGTARPTLRELDEDVLRRSDLITVDTRNGVFAEAGDCVVAKNWLRPERANELSELVCGRAPGRCSDRQITLFKSVGTAVQDISVAVKIYHNATKLGLGRELPDFPIIVDRSPPRLRH